MSTGALTHVSPAPGSIPAGSTYLPSVEVVKERPGAFAVGVAPGLLRVALCVAGLGLLHSAIDSTSDHDDRADDEERYHPAAWVRDCYG